MPMQKQLAAVAAMMAAIASSSTSAATIACPKTPGDARVLVQKLRKIGDGACNGGMFVPCVPRANYAPGALRPYGLVPSSVSWEEGFNLSAGVLSFNLTVPKERAMTALRTATGGACEEIDRSSCSVRSVSTRAMRVQLEYPSTTVALVCRYWN
jgi:hypothetical protein